jgi:hypothetical protein
VDPFVPRERYSLGADDWDHEPCAGNESSVASHRRGFPYAHTRQVLGETFEGSARCSRDGLALWSALLGRRYVDFGGWAVSVTGPAAGLCTGFLLAGPKSATMLCRRGVSANLKIDRHTDLADLWRKKITKRIWAILDKPGGPDMTTSEPEYMFNEAQMLRLLLCMLADENEAKGAEAVQDEIINIVLEWRRGRLLPKSETPLLMKLYAELKLYGDKLFGSMR